MNPLWTLLPPLLVIPFILYFGEARKNLREGAIIIAGIILLLLNVEIAESGSFPILADYSLKLSVEPMGVTFALLASFLWIITTIYSIGYMRGHHEENQTRFYTCFAIAISAVMAAAYADNLVTLFVAYEVLTLSTYPLVTHAGNADAKKGGRIYLGILMASSIGLLLPAIVWTATAANTLDFTAGGVLGSTGMSRGAMAILLALFTFGIAKAAVMPLHRWLPAAMVAPTPSIVAFTKDNLKARLAYSTISQLSYIVLAALLATTLSISGGVAHIVMHAFGKITLFFCAGAILVALHKKSISELDGIGRKMPITMAAFFIGAISIIGLPPTAGSWSKLMIAGGSFDGGTMFWALVLMLSTLLNICYLLPIPMRAFLKPLPDGASAERQEAPFASLCAIVITASFCILLFFNPQPLVELIGMIQWR